MGFNYLKTKYLEVLNENDGFKFAENPVLSLIYFLNKF